MCTPSRRSCKGSRIKSNQIKSSLSFQRFKVVALTRIFTPRDVLDNVANSGASEAFVAACSAAGFGQLGIGVGVAGTASVQVPCPWSRPFSWGRSSFRVTSNDDQKFLSAAFMEGGIQRAHRSSMKFSAQARLFKRLNREKRTEPNLPLAIFKPTRSPTKWCAPTPLSELLALGPADPSNQPSPTPPCFSNGKIAVPTCPT